jgi:hypothetical protein
MKKSFAFLPFSALLSLMLFAHEAVAVTPGYYVVTTYDEEDVKAIDFNFWNVKLPNASAVYAPQIGFSYGVTSRWFTELFGEDIHTDAGGTAFSNWSWENDYMITQGQYPIDLAMHTLITRFHNTNSGVGLEYGPVMQGDIGRVQLNGNIFFEREYEAGQTNRMQMKYQWQVKYRWKPQFAYGLEGFGELGEWRDWSPESAQSHRIGPAIFTTLHRAGDKVFKLDAAYLFGKIFGKEAKVFTLRAHYEF